MGKPKKVIENQQYEDYWKLTLEYSNIYGSKFKDCLNVILRFIDDNSEIVDRGVKYSKLQEKLSQIFKKKDDASTRKSINQFVKLGFVNSGLDGYHPLAKTFLRNGSKKDKQREIFSRIVYSNSSFNSSVTEEKFDNQISFFIKTLEEVGKIDKDGLAGLMCTDVSDFKKGYLTNDEFQSKINYAKMILFKERKYNQIRYTTTILKKLQDIVYVKGAFYFEEIIGDSFEDKEEKRDPYLQRLYKDALKIECKGIFGEICCMLSKVPYKALIASHIKPWKQCSPEEEFDDANGLLLGRDLDFLFDQGYITITQEGFIKSSKDLSDKIKDYHSLDEIQIAEVLLTDDRKKYLIYHNEYVFKK